MPIKLIAPPHTPMHADGSLNPSVVDAQAAYFLETGIRAVFVGGSTGESQSLTVEERLLLAQRWVDVTAETKLEVIVQVGHNCQADAIQMASHAGRIGANWIASLAPCFFKPATVRDLIEFCAPIAAAAADLPFYFYDIPALTGVELSMVDFLSEGSSQIPNLVGLKYTNNDMMQFQECVCWDDGRFEILFGSDGMLLAGYALGARGAIGSTYNFAAPLYHQMIEALEHGDYETSRAKQAQSVELIRILQSFGFPAAAKSVMALLGIDCGPARPPLRNLTAEQQSALQEKLETLDVLSAPV